MRITRFILVTLLSIICLACQQTKKPKPAHLRALSMMPSAQGELEITGKGKTNDIQKKISLHYAKSNNYVQLPPGHYKITYLVDDKPLLSGTFVMGKNGYYSLLLAGLLPHKWSVNPQSTLFHIKYFLAGSEIEDANQYLPQWFMLRDNYDGSKTHPYIRIINASPHNPAISIKDGRKTLKSGLAYPIETDMLKIKAGKHKLHLLYGNIHVADKMISAKAGYIYTIVIGDSQKGEDAPTIHVLSNPSRTLMESK